MPGIFISYRRIDSQDATGRIHDHLDMYFGREVTYRDIDRLHPGTDFVVELRKALNDCSLAIVVIGPGWLKASNNGLRRLDDPNDLVRVEVATALSRGMHVIPVLTGDHGMPAASDLPPDLEQLAFRQMIRISPTKGFAHGMRELVEEINRLTGLPFEDFPSVVRDCQRTGLVLIRGNFREDRTVLEEMATTRELLVVMNDGRGWLDQNQEIIFERLKDPGKITRVVLLHPTSPFIDTLIRKNKKSKAMQIGEIKRSYESLNMYTNASGHLDVRGHFGFNGYSLTMGDHYAFVSPYFFNESGALSLLKFSSRAQGGLYHRLKADAVELFNLAIPLKPEDFI
jgi:hypothetical protein